MKKKITAMLISAMCLAAATMNSVNVVSAADEETDVPVLMGDVNADGSFNVADVVLLQKWLLFIFNDYLGARLELEFLIEVRLFSLSRDRNSPLKIPMCITPFG